MVTVGEIYSIRTKLILQFSIERLSIKTLISSGFEVQYKETVSNLADLYTSEFRVDDGGLDKDGDGKVDLAEAAGVNVTAAPVDPEKAAANMYYREIGNIRSLFCLCTQILEYFRYPHKDGSTE